MNERSSVIEVCNYHGPYPGAFIPTLIAVGHAVEERLGLQYHCLFPQSMRQRPWVEMLAASRISTGFLPDRESSLAATRRLSSIASGKDAKLIRSHFSKWDIPAAVAAKRHGAAAVWHMHSGRGANPPVVKTAVKDLVKGRILGPRICDRVFAVSDEIGRLAERRGFPRSKVDVVLNGIDTSRFDGLAPRLEAQVALHLDPGVPVCLAFAWSPRTKGADIVADAARPLCEAGKLQLLLVGDSALLRESGVAAPWLRVIPPMDDVGLLFAATDVFVSASRDEGFPYAIGEAMAARIPVISSDIPGPSGYFGAAGVATFPSEDVDSLRAALEKLLQADDRSRLGDANRSFVQAHFSIDAHVDHVVEAFIGLLARRRGAEVVAA